MKIIELKNKLGELIIPKKWEPIGTIKMFDREQNMSKIYYGTWELTLKERSPIGINPNSTDNRFKTAGQQFGEKEHTLVIDEMPSHKHKTSITSSGMAISGSGNQSAITYFDSNYGSVETAEVGGNQPHNNIHPVEVVYFYKRIA